MKKTILENKAMDFPLENKALKTKECPCTYDDIMKKAKELNITFNQAAKLCK